LLAKGLALKPKTTLDGPQALITTEERTLGVMQKKDYCIKESPLQNKETCKYAMGEIRGREQASKTSEVTNPERPTNQSVRIVERLREQRQGSSAQRREKATTIRNSNHGLA